MSIEMTESFNKTYTSNSSLVEASEFQLPNSESQRPSFVFQIPISDFQLPTATYNSSAAVNSSKFGSWI